MAVNTAVAEARSSAADTSSTMPPLEFAVINPKDETETVTSISLYGTDKVLTSYFSFDEFASDYVLNDSHLAKSY